MTGELRQRTPEAEIAHQQFLKRCAEALAERNIAVRAIEAYLTADKKAHRQPKAAQILVALERIGYQLAQENQKESDS